MSSEEFILGHQNNFINDYISRTIEMKFTTIKKSMEEIGLKASDYVILVFDDTPQSLSEEDIFREIFMVVPKHMASRISITSPKLLGRVEGVEILIVTSGIRSGENGSIQFHVNVVRYSKENPTKINLPG